MAQSCPTLCDPMDCSPWNSPGQNTGVESLFLLQGYSQPRESNPLHADSLPAEPQGKPRCWSICLQCERPRFNPWVGKIPWSRKWQPTLIFLPREFHGHRSLVDSSPCHLLRSHCILAASTAWQSSSVPNAFSLHISGLQRSLHGLLSLSVHCVHTVVLFLSK